MATYYAKAISASAILINTDKGTFTTVLWDIDQPINVGDTLSVSGTPDSGIWNAYEYPRSVIGSPSSVFTLFTTPNGHFKGIMSGSNFRVELYDKDGVLVEGVTWGSSVSSNRCITLGYGFFRGSNGVIAFLAPSLISDISSVTDSSSIKSYTPNSANSFGWYSIVEITSPWGGYSISATIQQSHINKGAAIMDLRYIPPTDPYSEGGETEEGGGTGTFTGTGDDIDIPPLPTTGAVDTSFITIFNPTQAQLHSLASYMWGANFDLNLFKKIFADPMDCILGLSIVPVAVPNGGSSNVTVGNISTGVSMTKAGAQYVEVDCGSLNVEEFWGAYLDYEPYTKAEIYLPYIGTHAISTDDIMGKTVTVKYHVDILSGACAAYVKCGGTILYQFIGQCAASIPITGNDWTNVINGVLSIAGAVGSMVATGGASAPLASAGIASAAVNALKPNIEKSGSMSGTGGMMGLQKPYLILTRPRQAVASAQNKFIGYPSFINVSLDAIAGYNEIESVHLENIPCTNEELIEIENLLKAGVIFSGV